MTLTGLSEGALQVAAGSTSFVRGEDYVCYVHGLRITASGASASIQARNVYLVDLQWTPRVAGYCTCPHHAAGNFCKHIVAVGLAVLESAGSRQEVAGAGARLADEPDPLERLD